MWSQKNSTRYLLDQAKNKMFLVFHMQPRMKSENSGKHSKQYMCQWNLPVDHVRDWQSINILLPETSLWLLWPQIPADYNFNSGTGRFPVPDIYNKRETSIFSLIKKGLTTTNVLKVSKWIIVCVHKSIL